MHLRCAQEDASERNGALNLLYHSKLHILFSSLTGNTK